MRITYFLPFLLLASCWAKSPEQVSSEPEQKVVVERPSFSSDSAFSFIEKQCAFGPRVPNTDAHGKCASYLEEQLHRLTDRVVVQDFESVSFDGKTLKGKNIIGMIHPEMENRIALYSHWDSRPFCDHDDESNWHTPVMGANDGASGVAVLLELARQVRLSGDSVGIDIVFLDLEDYGQPSFSKTEEKDTWCLGSQYLARTPYSIVKPRMGILLDMVGGKDPLFAFDDVSSFYAMGHLQTVWDMAKNLGYGKWFVARESGSIIDDHYYINSIARIPTIDIIDYASDRGFPTVWHTVNDTPENIDKATLQMVGEVVWGYCRRN